MKLWLHWGVLLAVWVCSYLSIGIWPKRELLGLDQKSEIYTAVLFKPFHYLVGFLLMIFFVLLSSFLLRKLIYEWKIGLLFKKISYETIVIFILLVAIYIRMLFFFSYLLLIMTAIVLIIDLIAYVSHRKREEYYLKE